MTTPTDAPWCELAPGARAALAAPVRPLLRLLVAGLLLAAVSGCGGESGGEPTPLTPGAPHDPTAGSAAGGLWPPTARPELVDGFREKRAAPRHSSDGGGRAWLEDEAAAARARTPGSWTLLYEAGPEGIAPGGHIRLQVSPFWGWDTPQTEREDAPGFTRVTSDAQGVALQAFAADEQLLMIEIGGRGLRAGERVRIEYGAGPRGARADRYAERDSRFWFLVDGDGDRIPFVLPDSPALDVAPGPAAQLVLTLPSTTRPGEKARLTAAVLDASGSTGVRVTGTLRFPDAPPELELPESIRLEPAMEGRVALDVPVRAEGTWFLHGVFEPEGEASALGSSKLEALSNPLVSSPGQSPILWGDLHGHSNLSDGTGTPEDYYRYARDVAALDVAVLTDHDHWGMLFLDEHEDLWSEIRDVTARFDEPGRFVTLLGYEWTSWIWGHRHVLYFEDDGRVYSSIDEETDTPQELWDALRGQRAMTFAHHSAGGPIATDWDIPPDPVLEPLTEIVSVHGVSEAADAPGVIYRPLRGNFVRDALHRGYRLGFVGSGDSHDGHPGLAHLASPSGGLAAILAEERTRDSVLEALRARRTYATNGARIVLRTSLGGARMGSNLPAATSASSVDGTKTRAGVAAEVAEAPALELVFLVVGTAPVKSIDVVRSDQAVQRVDAEGRLQLSGALQLEGLDAGDWVYLRVEQEDGGMAWSSPFFLD